MTASISISSRAYAKPYPIGSFRNRLNTVGGRKDPTKSDVRNKKAITSDQGLNNQELQLLRKLQSRDREVRAHEQAHIAAGGQYVRSGASYQYETGPDGKRYAVAGEVSIDVSEEKDPRATIRKMNIVIRAALAPAHPSSKDRAVAAQAQVKAARATAELAETKRKEEASQGPAKDKSAGERSFDAKLGIQPAERSLMPPGTLLNIYG